MLYISFDEQRCDFDMVVFSQLSSMSQCIMDLNQIKMKKKAKFEIFVIDENRFKDMFIVGMRVQRSIASAQY